ncbi:membrane protein [Candidatus Omnitrophus magneticus]|uniref:Membrane protein n=4 Tax=Candidatus Omnitrophus magneticus TaxID=1609969 RepID=A0A0F0CMF8_9BACT|nr:membrane protein [Candidatus Omnitrophus magneticus]
MNKTDLEELVKKSVEFKEEKISASGFHLYLAILAEKYSININDYTNLARFTKYISGYDRLNIFMLYQEIERLENSVREKIYRTKDEEALYETVVLIYMLKRLYSMELTNGDYSVIEKNMAFYNAEKISLFLKDECAKYGIAMEEGYDIGEILSGISGAIEFYKTAVERDSAMIKNTVERMTKENRRVSALVTGGYHTEGLTKLMKENALSYLVIVPKFEAGKERPYVAVLTNKVKPYEKLLETGKYNIAVEAYFNKGDISKAIEIVSLNLCSAMLNSKNIDEIKNIWKGTYRQKHVELKQDNTKWDELLVEPISPEEFENMLDKDFIVERLDGGLVIAIYKKKAITAMEKLSSGNTKVKELTIEEKNEIRKRYEWTEKEITANLNKMASPQKDAWLEMLKSKEFFKTILKELEGENKVDAERVVRKLKSKGLIAQYKDIEELKQAVEVFVEKVLTNIVLKKSNEKDKLDTKIVDTIVSTTRAIPQPQPNKIKSEQDKTGAVIGAPWLREWLGEKWFAVYACFGAPIIESVFWIVPWKLGYGSGWSSIVCYFSFVFFHFVNMFNTKYVKNTVQVMMTRDFWAPSLVWIGTFFFIESSKYGIYINILFNVLFHCVINFRFYIFPLLLDVIYDFYERKMEQKMYQKKQIIDEIYKLVPMLRIRNWKFIRKEYLQDVLQILQHLTEEQRGKIKVINFITAKNPIKLFLYVFFLKFGRANYNEDMITVIDSQNRNTFRFVLAHEIGHLITHNNTEFMENFAQISWTKFDKKKQDIKKFFPYLFTLFKLTLAGMGGGVSFVSDNVIVRTLVISGLSLLFLEYLKNNYNKTKSDSWRPDFSKKQTFITQYSTVSPGEDAAESFACYLFYDSFLVKEKYDLLKKLLNDKDAEDFETTLSPSFIAYLFVVVSLYILLLAISMQSVIGIASICILTYFIYVIYFLEDKLDKNISLYSYLFSSLQNVGIVFILIGLLLFLTEKLLPPKYNKATNRSTVSIVRIVPPFKDKKKSPEKTEPLEQKKTIAEELNAPNPSNVSSEQVIPITTAELVTKKMDENNNRESATITNPKKQDDNKNNKIPSINTYFINNVAIITNNIDNNAKEKKKYNFTPLDSTTNDKDVVYRNELKGYRDKRIYDVLSEHVTWETLINNPDGYLSIELQNGLLNETIEITIYLLFASSEFFGVTTILNLEPNQNTIRIPIQGFLNSKPLINKESPIIGSNIYIIPFPVHTSILMGSKIHIPVSSSTSIRENIIKKVYFEFPLLVPPKKNIDLIPEQQFSPQGLKGITSIQSKSTAVLGAPWLKNWLGEKWFNVYAVIGAPIIESVFWIVPFTLGFDTFWSSLTAGGVFTLLHLINYLGPRAPGRMIQKKFSISASASTQKFLSFLIPALLVSIYTSFLIVTFSPFIVIIGNLLFHATINVWNITRPLFSEFKNQKSAENHNFNFQWLTPLAIIFIMLSIVFTFSHGVRVYKQNKIELKIADGLAEKTHINEVLLKQIWERSYSQIITYENFINVIKSYNNKDSYYIKLLKQALRILYSDNNLNKFIQLYENIPNIYILPDNSISMASYIPSPSVFVSAQYLRSTNKEDVLYGLLHEARHIYAIKLGETSSEKQAYFTNYEICEIRWPMKNGCSFFKWMADVTDAAPVKAKIPAEERSLWSMGIANSLAVLYDSLKIIRYPSMFYEEVMKEIDKKYNVTESENKSIKYIKYDVHGEDYSNIVYTLTFELNDPSLNKHAVKLDVIVALGGQDLLTLQIKSIDIRETILPKEANLVMNEWINKFKTIIGPVIGAIIIVLTSVSPALAATTISETSDGVSAFISSLPIQAMGICFGIIGIVFIIYLAWSKIINEINKKLGVNLNKKGDSSIIVGLAGFTNDVIKKILNILVHFKNYFQGFIISILNKKIPAQKKEITGNIYNFTDKEIIDEFYHGFLKNHVARLTVISMRIAKEMGLSKEMLNLIKYASLLHDVGADIRGVYETEFFNLSKELRNKYPGRSIKLAVEMLITDTANGAGINLESLDEQEKYNLFKKGISKLLGKELSPEEENGARAVYVDVGEENLKILQNKNIIISEELKSILKYHADFKGLQKEYETKNSLFTITKENMELVVSLLFLGDIFEHGNNSYTQIKQRGAKRTENFRETIKYAEKIFKEKGMNNSVIDVLKQLLIKHDKKIIATVLKAREVDTLFDEDEEFMNDLRTSGVNEKEQSQGLNFNISIGISDEYYTKLQSSGNIEELAKNLSIKKFIPLLGTSHEGMLAELNEKTHGQKNTVCALLDEYALSEMVDKTTGAIDVTKFEALIKDFTARLTEDMLRLKLGGELTPEKIARLSTEELKGVSGVYARTLPLESLGLLYKSVYDMEINKIHAEVVPNVSSMTEPARGLIQKASRDEKALFISLTAESLADLRFIANSIRDMGLNAEQASKFIQVNIFDSNITVDKLDKALEYSGLGAYLWKANVNLVNQSGSISLSDTIKIMQDTFGANIDVTKIAIGDTNHIELTDEDKDLLNDEKQAPLYVQMEGEGIVSELFRVVIEMSANNCEVPKNLGVVKQIEGILRAFIFKPIGKINYKDIVEKMKNYESIIIAA